MTVKSFIKYLYIFIIVLLIPIKVFASDHKLNIYLFHSKSCSHCKDEIRFLDSLNTKYPGLSVIELEVSNSNNRKLLEQVTNKLNIAISNIPFLVIGDEYIQGFLDDNTTGILIEEMVVNALNSQPMDIVNEIDFYHDLINGANETQSALQKQIITVPLVGTIDINAISLPALTLIVGFLDGFNPCAMWTLLFLIGLLIGTQNRKRMWILGITFIVVSGLVYFMFMAAWLSFFMLLGYSTVVKTGIGVLSVGAGSYYFWTAYKKAPGCETSDSDNKRQIMDKMRTVVQQHSLVLSMIGIAVLAFAVNLVELLCSAGFPAMYTGVLSRTPMPVWRYYSYLASYIFVFMLDDIIVFSIAMKTLKLVGIETKYGRFSHILGGIVMVLVGLFLLFR